jgi:hypothetical protein
MTIKILVLCVCILAIQGKAWWFSGLVKEELESFGAEFWKFINKEACNYRSVEEMAFREEVFKTNLIKVQELNGNPN